MHNLKQTLNLTDVYSYESLWTSIKHDRMLTALQQGKGIVSKDINAFLDSKLTVIDLYDWLVKALQEDRKDLTVVRYCVSDFCAAYDLLDAGEVVLTMLSSVCGRDNEIAYVQYKAEVNESDLKEIIFGFYGIDDALVNRAYDLVCSKITTEAFDRKRSVVRWRYSVGHSTESMLVSLEKKWEMYPEAYPWIKMPLNDYYSKYTKSNCSILVCYGPPGTGKTSFIRDYLCEQRMNAIVSYDASVLAADEMFTFFLGSPAYHALVIEDADDVLTSDRENNNKLIAKLLNSSDGLLKMPKKKIILSTNLENVSHIDEAILRPGRCFDFINFRKLTPTEQKPLLAKLGLNREIAGDASLAELYNVDDEDTYAPPTASKLGFV